MHPKTQRGNKSRLFRSLFSTGSLFGPDKGANLFSNLFSNSSIFNQGSGDKKNDTGSSIFEAGKEDKPKLSLFGNSTASLFANGGSSNINKDSGSIFGGLGTKNSIFSHQNAEAYNNEKKQGNDDGEEDGDSAELEKRQNM